MVSIDMNDPDLLKCQLKLLSEELEDQMAQNDKLRYTIEIYKQIVKHYQDEKAVELGWLND